MTASARAFIPRRTLLIGGLAFGATRAAAGPHPTPVITLLGDSITAGLGLPAADALPAQLQAALARRGVVATVRGAGVSGDTTAGGLARLDFSVQPDTTLCVIELGGNDYLQSTPAADTKRNLLAIIARLKARRIRVVVCSVAPPVKSSNGYGEEVNAFFSKLEVGDLCFTDIMEYGLALLGDTKAGKTTLAHYLIQNPLVGNNDLAY